jgi:signal transduction histidine kinase
LSELLESTRQRVGDLARAAGVDVRVHPATDFTLPARTANIAGLILANLLQNAIEASPRGSIVTIDAASREQRLEIRIADAGAGIPPAVQERLFRPVASGKRRGGGVGLAISRQLARHVSGELELEQTGPAGTVFRLRLPVVAANPVT